MAVVLRVGLPLRTGAWRRSCVDDSSGRQRGDAFELKSVAVCGEAMKAT
jgi:hypothetical protein